MVKVRLTYGFILIIGLLISIRGFAQDTTTYRHLLYFQNTALTLPQGRIEKGIFQPLRYGITPSTELSTFALGNLVNPNIGIKHQWKSWKRSTFSSFHQLSYPSPLLRRISRRGPGGLMPATTEVPAFINFNNRLLLSQQFDNGNVLSESVTLYYALGMGNNTMVSIDYPILYPRTNVYQNQYTLRFETSLIFHFHTFYHPNLEPNAVCVMGSPAYTQWTYLGSMNLFVLPSDELSGKLFWEHKGLFTKANSYKGTKSDSFIKAKLQFGYLMTYGKYPFGTDFSVFPLIDILWGKSPEN